MKQEYQVELFEPTWSQQQQQQEKKRIELGNAHRSFLSDQDIVHLITF